MQKCFFLGPKGTFAHKAALDLQKRNPNNKKEFIDCKSISEIINKVLQTPKSSGVIPIENSYDGSVGATLDNLAKIAKLNNLSLKNNRAHIISEIIEPVSFNLYCKNSDFVIENTDKAIKLFAHPISYAQCKNFLYNTYPKHDFVPCASNTSAIIEMLSNGGAAISTSFAHKYYKVHILYKNIQSENKHATRFIEIAYNPASSPSEKDRTSIIVYLKHEKPAELLKILKCLKKINMDYIHSRPFGHEGKYCFYIDLDGHILQKHISKALRRVERFADIKLLGSYKKSSLKDYMQNISEIP